MMLTPEDLKLKGLKLNKGLGNWDGVRNQRLQVAIQVDPSVEAINSWVNNLVRYVPDVKDYWQSPMETLATLQGDCEDFAILKRAMLLRAGYKTSDTALVIGFDKALRASHAVLVVKDNRGIFILDNVTQKVYKDFNETSMTPSFFLGDEVFLLSLEGEINAQENRLK